MAKINAISQAARQAIFDKSAGNLPYDPVSAGMSPEDIKKALYAFVTDGENSVLAELDRVIRETNSALGQVGAGGSTGDGSSCDCVAPQIRINSQTGFWEVSYDDGYSWESLGVKAKGADGEDGDDGVTPQLRINASTNYWEVSYDNGSSWTSLGVKATGEGGGGGGTTVEVPIVIFDDNNSAVQYFDLIQTASGIYKARLLIYTYVPNCVDFLDEYYYISNLDYIMTINELAQISRVSVSNCVLHSPDSKYSDFVGNGINNYSSSVPLPLGDEIVFGKNESGYYIKPSLIGGEDTYSYTWSSDWYVEIEFDAEQQLMLVNAYQCDLQKNI